MTAPSLNTRKILAFAAVVEIGTAIVLLINPARVVTLLLGVEVSPVEAMLGRCFAVALLALGFACWPVRQPAEGGGAAFRAMLIYNGLIALYLANLGVFGHLRGLLLWPAVVLHAVLTLLLIRARRDGRWTATIK